MKKPVIAPAEPRDVRELSFIAFTAKRYWGYSDAAMSSWSEELTVTPEMVNLLTFRKAVALDQIVGFSGLRLSGDSIAWLDHLWVRPEFMGKGWGRALFSDAERAAEIAGARILRIASDPHAEVFYHRMGLKTIGGVPAPLEAEPNRFLPLLEKALEHH